MIPIRRGKPVEMMRASGALARDILLATGEQIREGATTGEVDLFAADLIKKHGVKSAFLNYRGFPGNICISVNEEVVHGIGSDRVIQSGDIVKIDVGIVRDGWVGDNAMTVPVGEIDPQTHRLLFATEESLEVAIDHARDGVMLGDLSHSVEATAVKFGYTVVREFVGHGVGRKLHEEPQVPNYGEKGAKPRLRAGMILAIEPMINLGTASVKILADDWTVVTRDGKPSAHFEHTVLITKGDPEVLTPRPRTTTSESATKSPEIAVIP
ncbi:MAG: type I methionyl aminopeptidase [Verrucomicrobiota bacterium]